MDFLEFLDQQGIEYGYTKNGVIEVDDLAVYNKIIHVHDEGITSFPDNLFCLAWFDFAGSSMTSLPANMWVESMSLRDSQITTLPPDLRVWRCLCLTHSLIEEIPPTLKVMDLDLGHSRVKRLPSKLCVTGEIFWQESDLESAGDELTLAELDCSRLKHDVEVPLLKAKLLTVQYFANLRKTGNFLTTAEISAGQRSRLPETFVVQVGHCDLSHSCYGIMPKKMHVKGDLYMEEMPYLEALPDELYVGRHLYLYGCEHIKIDPAKHVIKGRVIYEPYDEGFIDEGD